MTLSINVIETRGCKRQELLIKKLLKIVEEEFKSIASKEAAKKDAKLDKRGKPKVISLSDCLMCGLAIFSLKFRLYCNLMNRCELPHL